MAQQDQERDIQEITFFGSQDTDTAAEGVKKGDFIYALNIINNSSGVGNTSIITTPKGNLRIPFDLPIGSNKCIGTAEDHENNKFYFFIWNDQDLHGIYRFDGSGKIVTRLVQNLTDTGAVNILNFSKDYLILHADVIMNDLLYWVDGLNNARKTNITKLLDKSTTGYGGLILQSYIDAYKQAAAFAPFAEYFSDVTKKFNRIYGALRKFSIRYIYDDGEKSNWSDFSNVPLPSFEPFNGISVIPTDNNCIKLTFKTGDRTVVKIEVAMQATSGAANELTNFQWVSVATIDKKRKGLSDNSDYTYNFYNDTTYAAVATEKIIRPYSFLPKVPWGQALVKNALVYAGGKEGSPVVDIDMSVAVTYEDLFLGDEVENEFNEPVFDSTNTGADFTYDGDFITDVNGVTSQIPPGQAGIRFTRITLNIGNDVKKGNKFQLTLANGYGTDTVVVEYLATNTDSALTVANKLKQKLVATGKIYRKTPDLPDTNIYDNIESAGDISFSFIIRPTRTKNYYFGSASVNPVQFDTLKNGGKSISNQKLGGSDKYAITYHDNPDGRKTAGYTDDSLIITYDTINDLGGLKKVIREITINHKPPIWARYYQIVRSADLIYGNYIQMLIQNVVNVNEDEAQDYIDLVVGSLFTFQKIHPNSPLKYDFKKGDILRLIKNVDTQVYYPNFETEIISYNPTVVDLVRDNVVTNGTNTVTVTLSDIKNIGKFIVIDSIERQIVDAPTGTTYLVNNVIGDSTPKTYLSYNLVDTRGTIRIRKPVDVTIADNSTVEIYTPASLSNPLGSKEFFYFQQQFEIINPGTENALHAGNIQDQSASQPAIIQFSSGTSYVHNREMPVNNSFPGTQLVIEPIEDPSYSDFYPSLINDNGRVTVEDSGDGEVSFPNRMRFSNNFIEDTRINGLNDFDNSDREDYYDDFGDIKRIVTDRNNILVFKELHTGYVPINARITIDDSGNQLRAGTAKLLNPIQYFSYEGGIGDNPEAYCSDGTSKYTVYPQAGVIIRIAANGEEPISKTFRLNKECREVLLKAVANKAKIFMGFNQNLSLLTITIEGFNEYIYFDGFNSWTVVSDVPPSPSTYEIVTPPTHGAAVLAGEEITYTPTTDYVGPDSFTYRLFIGGVWVTKKVCLTIVDTPKNTAWRQKATPFTCVLVGGIRNGYKAFDTLEEFYIFDNTPTGTEKPNVPEDPDYVPPIYDPAACSVQVPMVVNYDVEFGVDPFTWNGLIFMRNGVEVLRVQSVTSGTISGIYYTGDTIKVRQISSPTSFPWAPSSKANLTVDVNAVEVFNADISVQTIELQNYEAVIPNGTTTIDVTSTGSSTAVGYKTYALETTNGLAQDGLRVNIDDDTTSAFVVNVQPAAGGPSAFNFNVLDNADDMTVTIYNQSLYDVSCETVGALGYTDSSIILAGANLVLTGVPKGGLEVTTTAIFACGEFTPYTGGEAFPTEILITLGAATGTVELDFDAQTIPDKFIVEFDGVEVINTGYRGSASEQASLDDNLALRGLPPETITEPGFGTASFSKGTATTTALVKVYGPLPGTSWSLTLKCPVP